MAHLPTSELVAVGWLQSVPGIPVGKVATSLPADQSASADGFLTATVVGGAPDPDVPARRPVIQVDAFVSTVGSTKPRWGRANDLLELVRADFYRYPGRGARRVSLRAEYDDARVMSVRALTEPRRVEGDPGRYARFTMDIQMDWTTV